MDGPCKIEDLTIDATIHSDVMLVEGDLYLPARWREPSIEDVFCSNCGSYLMTDTEEGKSWYMGEQGKDLSTVVKEHLNK